MKIKIKSKSFIYMVSLFLLGRFCSFSYWPDWLSSIYTNTGKIVSAIILAVYLLEIKKTRPLFWIIASFYLFLGLSTFINNSPENLRRVFMELYPNLGLIALIDVGARRDSEAMITGFDYYLKTICVLNLILTLLNPGLFGRRTFLMANENHVIYGILISLIIAYIRQREYRLGFSSGLKRLVYYSYFSMLVGNIIIVFSGSNLLATVAFIISIVLLFRNIELFGRFKWIIGYFLVWFGVTIVRIQNWFAWLIIGILHKNLTLTNRVYIWDSVIEEIKKMPWIGHGRSETTNIIYLKIQHEYLSSHNQILQTLYEAGVIGLAIIILSICIASAYGYNYKESKNYVLIVAGIMGVLVTFLAEAPSYSAMFFLMSLLYNMGYICRREDTCDDHF